MNVPAAAQTTIPAFLAWCEQQERGRYDRRTVLHYRRQGADEPILLRIVTEGAIRLDPPGLDLTLTEIFA